MQYVKIIEILALVIPLLIGASSSLVKGNRKWIIAIVAYFILKKWAIKAATDKAKSELQSAGGNNPNALATLYKQALNSSGYDWMFELDGTEEDLIYQLAAETTNYKAVFDSYKSQYNRDLTADLQKELSATEYQRFLTILNK
ncbi:hypothetical protein [Dyadobacter aurulentus]|uniref:hypothetical protein n=1 Tax=Dyadobacter sp. UC 10 TaxID=2605428 RepID=UPI0011F3F0BB|nr:hypothetical protein [Dyadobacter sp. UC 10]KAA0992773.1 hypothetical protein FXO21_22640 [Dyadobacter sp. UC 10]